MGGFRLFELMAFSTETEAKSTMGLQWYLL